MQRNSFKLAGLGAIIALGLAAGRAEAGTTFVHLFEWKWNDIARECTEFLGPKGYDAVQISPPQEHITVSNWWGRYQPVSFLNLTSRSGTEAELAAMVQTCHAAGVKIYADVVMNNWANNTAGGSVGSGGSNWSVRNYPGLGPQDFHSSCLITAYTDANTVWNCELLGLPDLNTGASYPQQFAADYMNRLRALGVDGFRIDAAKHIAPGDLDNILGRANRPWVFLEVIGATGEAAAIQPPNYTFLGHVTEFGYGTGVAGNFYGQIKNLRNLRTSWGLLPSNQAVAFIDNHDRERGHGGSGNLTYKNGTLYNLANVFMLAYPYGYPSVLSSYQFTDPDAGPPSGSSNCSNSAWVCQHRWGNIANMVGFRNYTQSADSIDNWWDNGANAIAFGRGTRGFVLINNENSTVSQRLQTGLPAGQYCNVLSADDPCAGTTITVDASGYADFSVAAKSAAAIHGGALKSPCNNCVAQNFPSLNFRGTANAWVSTPMSLVGNNTWRTTVSFDGQANQRFKFDVLGDWSQNYGDTNADGTLERTGGDIFFTGSGSYVVEVNDQTLRYSLTPAATNAAPTARVSPASVTVSVGQSVSFDASGSSDSDGQITAYGWSTGGSGVTETVSFPSAGTYAVTLTVTDDDGATATATATVNVEQSGSFQSNFSTLNFRGTPNSWGTTPMNLVAHNTWEVALTFDGQANQRFKFDVLGDWSQNYGDTNADGTLERTGGDIYLAGTGQYVLQVNDQTLRYSVTKVGGFTSSLPTLNFRGTPNSWVSTPMSLVADNTWQAEVSFTGASGQRFKFDVRGDWSQNYGDNNADGTAELSGGDIYTTVSGNYLVSFNDLTRRYTLTPR